MGGLHGGTISSTDKALVLLYAGSYRPGFTNDTLSGCYLVYDASKNSVTAIPQLPDRYSFRGLGRGAAILSIGEGMLAAELVVARSVFPNAVLFLWQSPSTKWIQRNVCLPRVFSPDYFFRIDMAFAYADSCVCWVDLLKGVLICNLRESTHPQFTYVPLPVDCSIDVKHRRRPQTQEFRTMGSVGGTIKFVSLHGYNEGLSREEVMLKTWTLSHDLKEWMPGRCLFVKDLLNSFLERNLPMVKPSFPVVSKDEPEVIYLVLNYVDCVHVVDMFGHICGVSKVSKTQYVISLDMLQKKILRHTKFIPDNIAPYFSSLIATEFTAYLQCPMEGGLEAREASGSQKKNQTEHAMKPEGSRKGSRKQMLH